MRKIITLGFLSIFYFSFSQETARKLNDSAINIYIQDPQKALLLLEQAESLAIAKDLKEELAVAKVRQGIVYRQLGRFKESIELSKKALSLSKDSIVNASAYNNIGASCRQLGQYEEALSNYQKSLDLYLGLKRDKEVATVNNNIGMVYSYLNVNDKAIEYHLKAKTVFEDLNNKKGISEVYNNIAIIYANDGNLENALDYFKYSLEIERELNDKKGIAESANNVGAVFYYLQEIDSALVYFNNSAYMERTLGNFSGVADSYNNIAQTLIETNRVNESKRYIDSAYLYAEKYNIATALESSLYNYSTYFEAKNDTKKALNYYKELAKLRDSLVNVETASKVAELDIKYQTEKKEKEILSQRADIAEKDLSISKKNNYMLGLGALAVVFGLLGYLFYNQQKLKNRQLQKENELKDALLKIETQNKLQEQRLRISRDLHDNIGAQLTFIISCLDNLKYGFKIPEKLTDKLKGISEFTTTTIQELRDTIWAMNKDEITFEDLEVRISNFIDKANLAAQDIKFKFKVADDVDMSKSFTSVNGMNIYRIIQESINNSIKYAESSRVNVTISESNNKMNITIQDNGNGFDESNIELGNGLQNMKKRALEIGGNLNIKSELEKGTSIILEL